MVAALWSSRVDRRSLSHADLAYRLLTAIGVVLLFDLHLSWHWSAATVWRTGSATGWILAATTIAGFAVAWWARITLGRLWSGSVTRKVDHEIISAGPYRIVRHPIYSGLLLSCFSLTSNLRPPTSNSSPSPLACYAAARDTSCSAAYWCSSSRAMNGTNSGNKRSRIHCPTVPSCLS